MQGQSPPPEELLDSWHSSSELQTPLSSSSTTLRTDWREDAGIIDQARRKLNADFTLEELLNAKNRMRKHKAGGSDGVAFVFFRGECVPGSIGNHTYSPIDNVFLTLYLTTYYDSGSTLRHGV